MPGLVGPNIGLVWGYAEGDDGWGYGSYNPGFAKLDTLLHLAVIAKANTPPGSPTDGDRYLVGDSPTGVWGGHAGTIAVYLAIGGPDWAYYTPKVGWRVHNIADGLPYLYDGSNWLTDAMYSIGSSGDPTVLLTNDQDLLYHRVGSALTFPINFGPYRGLRSEAGCVVAATGATAILVQRAASSAPSTFATVGLITFAAGAFNPVFTTSGGTSQDMSEGDVLRLRAPATADATFKGFYSTLLAYRR